MTTTRDNTETPQARPAADTSRTEPSRARALPTEAPVDVPRAPTPDNAIDDVAGREAKQRVNPSADTSWADTATPAPNKKTVRSNPY